MWGHYGAGVVGVSSRERLEHLEDVLKLEQLRLHLAVRILEIDLGRLHSIALDLVDPVEGAGGLISCLQASARSSSGRCAGQYG